METAQCFKAVAFGWLHCPRQAREAAVAEVQRRGWRPVRLVAQWTRRHLAMWILAAGATNTAVIALLAELLTRPGQSGGAVDRWILVSLVPLTFAVAFPIAGHIVEERDEAERKLGSARAAPAGPSRRLGPPDGATVAKDRQRMGQPAGRQVVVGNVPQSPQAFQPRENHLGSLRAAGPGMTVVCAVTGMRGVGKTQVAAAYARECINARWRLVAWVNAEDLAAALADLAVVADRLGIRRDTSIEEPGQVVRGWLEARGEACLVVFDNVTDLAALRPYIPAAGEARVVLTSAAVLPIGRQVLVDVFTEDEALAFLAERTALNDPVGARELSRELGCLPLALAQAAAVVAAQRLSFGTYLERLRRLPLGDYLAPVQGEPYPRGAAEAIVLSVDAVVAADRTGLCGGLLDLVAVLSPAGVSRRVLHKAGEAGVLSPGDPVAIDEALGRLAGASLLAWSENGATVAAHRLVTRVTRERCARNDVLATVVGRACALLGHVKNSAMEQWPDPSPAREAVAHVIALHDQATGLLADEDPTVKNLLVLRCWVLRCLGDLQRRGDVAQALELSEPIQTDCIRLLGETHHETAANADQIHWLHGMKHLGLG